jgi:flavin reductase (DIM6/NTAB) family NADH-FMN oxidoreductase RutF
VTANAVSSLSLDPMLLLACIDRKSSSHALFERADAFAVNILEAGQRPLSDMFSRHGAPEQPMGGAPYRLGVLGSPLLEGTLAYAECRIAERFSGGDHTIVIGEVEDMAIERPEREPLVFFSGAYRQLNGGH